MQSVEEIATEIVRREGGYVNDPDDPGGATNFGVTIHTMRRLGLDLDRDGDVDATDVRMLSRAQATDIFITHYFIRPRIGDLPAPLHATVFDMYVNAGGNAIKILQRLLTEMGHPCVVDGALGPQSIGAAHAAAQQAPGAETGWHRHEMDYVITALPDCRLLLEEPGGESREVLVPAGTVYRRDEGVEHNVINGGDTLMSFVETELK